MRGEGVWAELIAQRLAKAKRRFGLDRERRELDVVAVQEAAAAEPASARATCSAEARESRAQSATSGSKKSQCTCGNAAAKAPLDAVDRLDQRVRRSGRPHLRLDRDHDVAAELLREQVVDGSRPPSCADEVLAHPLEDAGSTLWPIRSALTSMPTSTATSDEQHADADRAGRVPRRVAGERARGR